MGKIDRSKPILFVGEKDAGSGRRGVEATANKDKSNVSPAVLTGAATPLPVAAPTNMNTAKRKIIRPQFWHARKRSKLQKAHQRCGGDGGGGSRTDKGQPRLHHPRPTADRWHRHTRANRQQRNRGGRCPGGVRAGSRGCQQQRHRLSSVWKVFGAATTISGDSSGNNRRRVRAGR